MSTSSRNYSAKWRERNREKCQEYARNWAAKNKDKLRIISNKFKEKLRKENPGYLRDVNYKYMYGITLQDYDKMEVEQDFLCYICKKPEAILDKGGKIRRLSVDHCHTTGKIRKLLCFRCNSNLGKYEKYRDWAEVYLSEFL